MSRIRHPPRTPGRCTDFLLAPQGISRRAQEVVKVWNYIPAFFFEQSYIGSFAFENWTALVGVPAFVLVLWMLEKRW
jgi:hypothetical protein